MKAKTNTVLIVVALLAYWIGLCNASAFYDPGTQRWLNRDPLLEQGFTSLSTLRKSLASPRLFSYVAGVETPHEFCGNDPITSIDPKGTQVQILRILVPRLFPKYSLGGPYVRPSCNLTGFTTTSAPIGPNATICTYQCIPGGTSDETSSQPQTVTYAVAPCQSCPSSPANAPRDPNMN